MTDDRIEIRHPIARFGDKNAPSQGYQGKFTLDPPPVPNGLSQYRILHCSKCGTDKLETEFGVCDGVKRGRRYKCKTCQREYDRARHIRNKAKREAFKAEEAERVVRNTAPKEYANAPGKAITMPNTNTPPGKNTYIKTRGKPCRHCNAAPPYWVYIKSSGLAAANVSHYNTCYPCTLKRVSEHHQKRTAAIKQVVMTETAKRPSSWDWVANEQGFRYNDILRRKKERTKPKEMVAVSKGLTKRDVFIVAAAVGITIVILLTLSVLVLLAAYILRGW